MTPGFLRKVFGVVDGTTPPIGEPSQFDAAQEVGESQQVGEPQQIGAPTAAVR